MLLTLVAATSLPVTLEEAKAHLRVDHSSEDAVVERALRAAVAYVEQHTSLVLAPTTLQLRLNEWSWDCLSRNEIHLPRAPVRDVTAVTYLDENDDEQTVDVADYSWERTPEGATILFDDGWSAPNLHARRKGAVRITFDAGFDDPAGSGSGDDPALEMPPTLPIAVLMLTGWWYERREAAGPDQTHPTIMAVEAILAQVRVYR